MVTSQTRYKIKDWEKILTPCGRTVLCTGCSQMCTNSASHWNTCRGAPGFYYSWVKLKTQTYFRWLFINLLQISVLYVACTFLVLWFFLWLVIIKGESSGCVLTVANWRQMIFKLFKMCFFRWNNHDFGLNLIKF